MEEGFFKSPPPTAVRFPAPLPVRRTSEKRIVRAALAAAALCLFASGASSAKAQTPSTLTAVETSAAGEVSFTLTGPAQAVRTFALRDPIRLAVDFQGVVPAPGLIEMQREVNLPPLVRVRSGRFQPETARVVLELSMETGWRMEGETTSRPWLVLEGAAGAGGLAGPKAPAVAAPTAPTQPVVVKAESAGKTAGESKDKTLARGVVYRHRDETLAGGRAVYHLLEIDPEASGLELRVVQADPHNLRKTARLADLAQNAGALGGINGGYYNVKTGSPIDLLIVDRKVLSLPVRYRAALAVDNRGRPQIVRPNIGVNLQAPGGRLLYVNGLNRERNNNETVAYTAPFGPRTGTKPGGYELVVDGLSVVSVGSHDGAIPKQGFVISVGPNSPSAEDLRLKPGDELRLTFSAWPDLTTLRHAVSAGPTLVEEGRTRDVLIEDFGLDSSILKGRHPRSAVGLTKDGRILLLAAEGRNERTEGMTLSDLGKTMKRFGAVMAMNLDGGGSTTLMWDGRTLNRLSDGAQRKLNNALVLVKKK